MLGGGGGEKMSERTRGPIERVRAAGGNGAHGAEQPPLPRQWFSQRFAPASLRFASLLARDLLRVRPRAPRTSRAPQLSRARSMSSRHIGSHVRATFE